MKANYFKIFNPYFKLNYETSKSGESDYLSNIYEYDYQIDNEYINVQFFSNKTLAEIDYEIFSTKNQIFRDKMFYKNIKEIEDYFSEKYNYSFFDRNKSGRLFSQTFESIKNDFEKILKPNLIKPLYIELVEGNIDDDYLINWDFFSDRNRNNIDHIRNIIYENFFYIFSENRKMKFDKSVNNKSQFVIYVMRILFESCYVSHSIELEGLSFIKSLKFAENFNPTIQKYFFIESDYKNIIKILPHLNAYENFYNNNLEDIGVILKDFTEIKIFFDNNIKFVAKINNA